MCWQSSSSEPAHQALCASLTLNKAERKMCYQKWWFQIKREYQVVLLLFNLRLSYKQEERTSYNYKPSSGHWQHCLINPPQQKVCQWNHWAEHFILAACSCWPQVRPLGFGFTLTFWSQELLERLWPISVNIFLEVIDPQRKEGFTCYFLLL